MPSLFIKRLRKFFLHIRDKQSKTTKDKNQSLNVGVSSTSTIDKQLELLGTSISGESLIMASLSDKLNPSMGENSKGEINTYANEEKSPEVEAVRETLSRAVEYLRSSDTVSREDIEPPLEPESARRPYVQSVGL